MGLFTGTSLEPQCPDCHRPESQCDCPPEKVARRKQLPPGKQKAVLSLEKRKKGKLMTVIRGLSDESNDLPALLTRFKQSLGVGGTLEDSLLELQGDQRDRARALLQDWGYQVGR